MSSFSCKFLQLAKSENSFIPSSTPWVCSIKRKVVAYFYEYFINNNYVISILFLILV